MILNLLRICNLHLSQYHIGGNRMLSSELFLKALEEWDEKTPDKDPNTLNSYIIYMLLHHLGWIKYRKPNYEIINKLTFSKELCLAEFKDYLHHLDEDSEFGDYFLFSGLKNLFSAFFQYRIEQLGARIIQYREMVDSQIDYYGSIDKIPSNEMYKYEEYKRITSEEYIKRIKFEKQVWDMVCIKYFNKEAEGNYFIYHCFTCYM